MLTLPIRDVLRATPRARIVRLDLNGHTFDYAAGQAVLVADSGSDKRRPYSISASPEDSRREKSVELLVSIDGEGSQGPSFDVAAGRLVDVEGPLGTFTFPDRPKETCFVFIAGGTGIAPLRAMLRHALTIPHREIGLFYSARTPEEFAYGDEFRALAARNEIELRETVTRSESAAWTGARGRFTRAALGELVHDRATLCFVCGPPALVHGVPKLLQELGIARERIRVEEWS